MESTYLHQLASLRTVVGYLGERDQFGWWQSSFFGQGGKAFLTPVFARSSWLAQVTGVTQAATRIHDERIGVGAVFHLFRLPDVVEQDLHHTLQGNPPAELSTVVANQEAALGYLRAFAGAPAAGMGPTRVGSSADLQGIVAWGAVAARYLYGFTHGEPIYPYFVGSNE